AAARADVGGVAGGGPARTAHGPVAAAPAAAKEGGVAGEDAIADRQGPGVVQATAGDTGLAPRNRQAGDAYGLSSIDREDAEAGGGGPGIPSHGCIARSETVDGDVPLQVGQGRFQGDRAGSHDVDDVTLAGSGVIGLRNRLPQGAGSGIGQRSDREGDHGGSQTLFQLFQGQVSKGGALVPPRA